MAIDFLIGMAIFIAAVLFALQFMTSAVSPLTSSPEEVNVASNKVSEAVVSDERWLGTGQRGVVDVTDERLGAIHNASAQDVGAPIGFRLNVTVFDEDGERVGAAGDDFDLVSGNVATSRRIAYAEARDEIVTVVVRVW